MAPLLKFEWMRPEKGFIWWQGAAPAWAKLPADDPRWLLSSARDDHWLLTDAQWPNYTRTLGVAVTPLADEPVLFRTFASLAPTPDAVLAFANQYGALGIESEDVEIPIEGRALPHLTTGERLATWRREIWLMGHAVALWAAVKHADVVTLRRMVRWVRGLSEADKETMRRGLAEHGMPASKIAATVRTVDAKHARVQMLADGQPLAEPMRADRFGVSIEPDNLILAGWVVLLETANQQLRQLAPELWFVGQRQPAVLQMRPRSLRDALWVQFAQAIGGGMEQRQCENPRCGKWFEVAPTSRRRHCQDSAACRQAAHRARKPKPTSKTRDAQTKRT